MKLLFNLFFIYTNLVGLSGLKRYTNKAIAMKIFVLSLFFFSINTALFAQKAIKIKLFENGALKQKIKLQNNEKAFSSYLDKQKQQLVEQNYINAQLDSFLYTSKSTAKLYFSTGKKWHAQFSVLGLDSLKASREFPFNTTFINFHTFNKAQHDILKNLQNKGYPFINLHYQFYFDTTNKYSVEAIYSNVQFIRISKISIKSKQNILTDRVLARYLELIPGNAFLLKDWENAEFKLSKLSVVNSLKAPDLELSEKGAVLYFYLQAQKKYYASGLIGFQMKDKQFNLVGEAQVHLENMFRSLETLNLQWASQGKLQRTLFAELNWPFLFASPLGTNLKIDLRQQDSTFLRLQADNAFILNLNHFIKISFLNQWFSSTYQNDTEKSTSYFINGLGFSVENRKRNSLSYFVHASCLVSGFNANIPTFYKLNSQTWGQIMLNQNYSLQSQLTIFYTNKKNMISSELIPLGGFKTLVGSNDNSFYAKNYGALRFEWQGKQAIGPDLLLDNLYYSSDGKTYNWLKGMGAGMIIRQQNFEFQFVFGSVLQKNNINLSNSKLHFKIISYF